MKKYLTTAFLAFGLIGAAHAANINYIGTTTGAFDADVQACVDSLAGMTFTCAAGGFNSTSDPSGLWGATLGSFTLDNSIFNYSTHTFTIDVSFSTPAGVTPNPGVYTAALSGNITGIGSQNVNVTFLGAPLHFTYDGGGFTFSPNNVSVASDGLPVTLTGSGVDDASATPEPASMAMLGGGLCGIAFLLRRRTKV
jgi:hypothetical protein